MSSVRIQHDVYAQVLVNHVYDSDVLSRIKTNTGETSLFSGGENERSSVNDWFSDEYATYVKLIDEILEQRYNYVIQSRRTIETFPVGQLAQGLRVVSSLCTRLVRRCQISSTRNSRTAPTATALPSKRTSF